MSKKGTESREKRTKLKSKKKENALFHRWEVYKDKKGWFYNIYDDRGVHMWNKPPYYKTKAEAVKAAKKMFYVDGPAGRWFKNPLPDVCPYCGLEYDKFRTGASFASVRADMWKSDDDPAQWKYKRRHGVLGSWRGLKQMMWRDHIDMCEQGSSEQEDQEVPF